MFSINCIQDWNFHFVCVLPHYLKIGYTNWEFTSDCKFPVIVQHPSVPHKLFYFVFTSRSGGFLVYLVFYLSRSFKCACVTRSRPTEPVLLWPGLVPLYPTTRADCFTFPLHSIRESEYLLSLTGIQARSKRSRSPAHPGPPTMA